MSNQPRFGFVLEYVTDIEATKRFYVDVLGLKVERYHPTYVQFSNFAIASDESMSDTRARELYWLVDDAEAAFKDFSQKAQVILPLSSKPFGRVFGIQDSAGQPLYILEFAKERPSQPVS